MSYVVTWKFKGGSVEHVRAVADEREARTMVQYMNQVNASTPFAGIYSEIGYEEVRFVDRDHGPQPWHAFGGRRM